VQAHVEESLDSHYTCLMCLKPFTDPVACVPCGHAYCRACLAGTTSGGAGSMGWCQECGGSTVQQVMPVPNLESLASKYEFKLQALRDLQTLCAGFEVAEQSEV
jgi:RING-type zinc-finger